MSCRTGHHLVQRAVSAAGIEPQFFTGFRCFPGNPDSLTGGGGNTDLIIHLSGTADFVDDLAVFLRPVPASRSGVDNKQVFHIGDYFFFRWLSVYI